MFGIVIVLGVCVVRTAAKDGIAEPYLDEGAQARTRSSNTALIRRRMKWPQSAVHFGSSRSPEPFVVVAEFPREDWNRAMYDIRMKHWTRSTVRATRTSLFVEACSHRSRY